jgi:hypothetical protein
METKINYQAYAAYFFKMLKQPHSQVRQKIRLIYLKVFQSTSKIQKKTIIQEKSRRHSIACAAARKGQTSQKTNSLRSMRMLHSLDFVLITLYCASTCRIRSARYLQPGSTEALAARSTNFLKTIGFEEFQQHRFKLADSASAETTENYNRPSTSASARTPLTS